MEFKAGRRGVYQQTVILATAVTAVITTLEWKEGVSTDDRIAGQKSKVSSFWKERLDILGPIDKTSCRP